MKKETTFEQAMNRLDEIVAALDGGQSTHDESPKLFSEGAELISFCNGKLNDAELPVERRLPGETGED